MFSTVLIANRGEIACRIIRTARRLGIRTVAVYSEADVTSPHVALADSACCIGASDVHASYLNGKAILDAARKMGVEAIHPGYGFLSENADFAEACESAGLVFIGPDPNAIRLMGLKDEAKAIAQRAGVPVIPGYRGTEQADKALLREAEAIGYPIIIKAIAGGGGRGMRVVYEPSAFGPALEACRREAKSAFGNDRVLLEKYFSSSRHIEVQLMGDAHGTVLHLFERDCSVQRRHQKIIEEAPAHGIDPAMRARMHAAAVAIARQIAYRNAGTVEFLYEESGNGFFFMEMNTRLQVEHPVTELITGLDLVELQLRVAAGERLAMTQEQVRAAGHAVEARIYAEDPAQGFLPQTGIVHDVAWPQAGGGAIRVDAGIVLGSTVTRFYDAMIAKAIAWGESRARAIEALREALGGSVLFGLKTNKGFLLSVLSDERFAARAPNTGFLDTLAPEDVRPAESLLALACAGWLYLRSDTDGDPWSAREGWIIGGRRREHRRLVLQGSAMRVVADYGQDAVTIAIDGSAHVVEILASENGALRALVDGAPAQARFLRVGQSLFADVEGHHLTLSEPDYAQQRIAPGGSGSVRAPMPGRVLAIEVEPGAMIGEGGRLMVLEAMKMEHVLRAPIAGRMKDILVRAGDQVREGDVLCIIDSDGGPSSSP
jgi:3-methylcrotonyl-CoA carboxylase alpha subunit